MTKVNNSAGVSHLKFQDQPHNQQKAAVSKDSQISTEPTLTRSSGSLSETFNTRAGIDRASIQKANLANGLHSKKKGDRVQVEDEYGNKKDGYVLNDLGEDLEVITGDQVLTVSKSNGKAHGRRKATQAEIAQYQMWQAQFQEQQRQEEQRAEQQRDEVKADQRRADQRKYDMKVSLEKSEQKKLAIKKAEYKESEREIRESIIKQNSPKAQEINQTQSVAQKFQINVVKTEHETLTVSRALQIEEKNEKLKNDLK